VAIFGNNLKQAADTNERGQHLFFDPSYISEYRQCYDERAKKSMEKYMLAVAPIIPAMPAGSAHLSNLIPQGQDNY